MKHAPLHFRLWTRETKIKICVVYVQHYIY